MTTTNIAFDLTDPVSLLSDSPEYFRIGRIGSGNTTSASAGASVSTVEQSVSSVTARAVGQLRDYCRVMLRPKTTTLEDRAFIPLQHWEGVVESIDEKAKTFGARLLDRNDVEPRYDFADGIPLDDIDPDDRELLTLGAIFYWTIGYSGGRNRQRVRESRLQFQRLPISSGEYFRAVEAAKGLVELSATYESLVRQLATPPIQYQSWHASADHVLLAQERALEAVRKSPSLLEEKLRKLEVGQVNSSKSVDKES